MGTFALAVSGSALSACVGAAEMDNAGRSNGDDIPYAGICLADPDDFDGCDGPWTCEIFADGNKRCIDHSALPDDSGDWTCRAHAGVSVCTSRAFPDRDAPGGWTCERAGEFVECTRDSEYPDGGAWVCRYQGDERICDQQQVVPPSPEHPGTLSSGDDDDDMPGENQTSPGDDDDDDAPPSGDDDDDAPPPGDDDDDAPPPGDDDDAPPPGGACDTYYSAKWDADGFLCEDISNGSGEFCLDGGSGGTSNGCGMASISRAGSEWNLRLPSNCRFVEAASKCATLCEDASTSGAGGTFHTCSGHGISHIEVTWCCTE